MGAKCSDGGTCVYLSSAFHERSVESFMGMEQEINRFPFLVAVTLTVIVPKT